LLIFPHANKKHPSSKFKELGIFAKTANKRSIANLINGINIAINPIDIIAI